MAPSELAIDAALNFLAQAQKPWGEFASQRFTNPELAGRGLTDSSPFTTTFVLYALRSLGFPAAAAMRQAALAFLASEREVNGVWRYWTSRQQTSIDPDLDDTCCAAFALRQAGSEESAPLDTILANRHESGLFKTWIRSPDQPNDVDCAVNANVLLLLGERVETIAARDILVTVIEQHREAEASWYYPDPLCLYFMVARAFHHGVTGFGLCRSSLIPRVEQRLLDPRRTSLAVAMSLIILRYFGVEPAGQHRSSLAWLLERQQPNGAWPRAAFYTGPEPPAPHQVWWGSEELTTAFCLEAIAGSVNPAEVSA